MFVKFSNFFEKFEFLRISFFSRFEFLHGFFFGCRFFVILNPIFVIFYFQKIYLDILGVFVWLLLLVSLF